MENKLSMLNGLVGTYINGCKVIGYKLLDNSNALITVVRNGLEYQLPAKFETENLFKRSKA